MSRAKRFFPYALAGGLIILQMSAAFFLINNYPLTDYNLYSTYRKVDETSLYRIRVTQEDGRQHFVNDESFDFHFILSDGIDPHSKVTRRYLHPVRRFVPVYPPEQMLAYFVDSDLFGAPQRVEVLRTDVHRKTDGALEIIDIPVVEYVP